MFFYCSMKGKNKMTEKFIKPKSPIVGADGNIFNLIGIASRSLKKEGYYEEANEMSSRVMSSNSYDEALSIILEYIDPVDTYYIENEYGCMDYE